MNISDTSILVYSKNRLAKRVTKVRYLILSKCELSYIYSIQRNNPASNLANIKSIDAKLRIRLFMTLLWIANTSSILQYYEIYVAT